MKRKRLGAVCVLVLGLLTSPFTRPVMASSLSIPGQDQQASRQFGPLRLEDGTPIKLRLSRTLSSATAQIDERVDFDVLEEVKVGDLVVIPKGSIAWGTVTEAQAKRRMGRGGKLDVNIDSVRLANGDKAALRGVKEAKGGGHGGAMAGAMVATSLVVWPAAPFFLFMHGKDITIPKGTELSVYTNGDMPLDPAKFGGGNATNQPASTAIGGATTTQPSVLSNSKALGKTDILDLLKGEVPSARVTELVKQRGIKFAPTEDDYKEIRAAGGADELVNVLKAAALMRE